MVRSTCSVLLLLVGLLGLVPVESSTRTCTDEPVPHGRGRELGDVTLQFRVGALTASRCATSSSAVGDG
jgi:hypothetical protein